MTATRSPRVFLAAALAATALSWARPAAAQVQPCPEPVKLPPASSPVLLRCMQLVAHPVNETVVDPQTYGFYIKTPQTDSQTDT